jgi:uncharacterized protein
MPYALVTGSTSGIGAAFARLLAREGYDLVLVARDGQRNEALGAELTASVRVKVEVMVADLSTEQGRALVEERVADHTRPIEVLVNNAGFGLRESFKNSTLADEQAQLDVLVTAPLRFSHVALPAMLSRGRGFIINVGSVAAFIPANTYSSAKSYLTVFSEALSSQLAGTGVRACVVAPGYTHTEFHERAGMDMSALPEFLWLDATAVAEQAWRDCKAGKALSVPGGQYQVLSTLARYAPRPWVRLAALRRPGPRLRD